MTNVLVEEIHHLSFKTSTRIVLGGSTSLACSVEL